MSDVSVLLPMLLKRSGRLIDSIIDRVLKQHGVARSQYRVLFYVARYGEPTQKELSEALGVRGPTMTSMLDSLSQKGWLVRTGDKQDGRAKRVRLTPKGRKLYKSIPDPVKSLDHDIMQVLSKNEARDLERMMQKIIARLNETK